MDLRSLLQIWGKHYEDIFTDKLRFVRDELRQT